ncbi:MAG: hypothetical protein SFY80_06680 [Verrucomicrobiota bacterium]|nr:hypothetical protein [Verrucomicrobiota bacterium]
MKDTIPKGFTLCDEDDVRITKLQKQFLKQFKYSPKRTHLMRIILRHGTAVFTTIGPAVIKDWLSSSEDPSYYLTKIPVNVLLNKEDLAHLDVIKAHVAATCDGYDINLRDIIRLVLELGQNSLIEQVKAEPPPPPIIEPLLQTKVSRSSRRTKSSVPDVTGMSDFMQTHFGKKH